jgi:hypothetical protein
MTAAGILLGIDPVVAGLLLNFLDVARGSDEAIFKSRELVDGLTLEQARQLRLIVSTLGSTPNVWTQ